MNKIIEIQEFVKKKTQNLISEPKAEIILKRLEMEYPTKTFPEAMQALDLFPIAPSWMRNIVAINETFFFRHPEHFDLLRTFTSKCTQGETLEILCAGVSHGQEAYSIAMLLTEILPKQTPFHVTAFDIDEEAICLAKAARYSEMEIKRTPDSYVALLRKYLKEEPTPDGPVYSVPEEIKLHVRFVCGNIFQSILTRYHIIFVRNILIYFQEESRLQLLNKLRERLKPEGLLFIGGGELFPLSFKLEVLERSPSVLEKGVA